MIGINPKEYFEKYKDFSVNKKHKRMKKKKKKNRNGFWSTFREISNIAQILFW